MNPEIKAKWVEALRSGKYQQGRKKLRSEDDHFCCLGVLCDLIAPTKWEKGEGGAGYGMNSFWGVPPHEIDEVSDLDGQQMEVLMGMNDGGQPFSVIADYIEANL